MLDNFLENYFKIERAYRRFFHSEMEKYQITPNEMLIILFLHEHGSQSNTAKNIAEYGGVSKGMIARSVESLIEKEYLRSERDRQDRRLVHLYLTQNCDGIVQQIAWKQKKFLERIQEGISKEDIGIMTTTVKQLMENAICLCEETQEEM